MLPERDPELYFQSLLEGGLSQAYTLSSRKRAWAEIERFEKALADVEATLREKGRTEHLDEITALRGELRKRTSRIHSKNTLFEITQDIRRRYAELDAAFEIHGTKGLPPIDSVLFPDPQRALSEISLDLAVIQPNNHKNKADVAAARELYAQYLSSGLSNVLEPARAEGVKVTISRDAKSGVSKVAVTRGDSAPVEIRFTEKNLSDLPSRLHKEMRTLSTVQSWESLGGAFSQSEGCLGQVVDQLRNRIPEGG